MTEIRKLVKEWRHFYDLLDMALEELVGNLSEELDSELRIYLKKTAGLEDPLKKIYKIERKIYDKLSQHVKSSKHVIPDSIATFRDFADEDKDARDKKDINACLLSECTEEWQLRAEIRGIVKPHWDLINWTSNVVFPVDIKKELEKLTNELEKMSWLFSVFISYSSKDEEDVQRFVRIAAGVPETRHLKFWKYTYEIAGGDDYERQTQEDMKKSAMYLIFVTPTFMTSADMEAEVRRPVAKYELPLMLEERQNRGKLIYPIFLKEFEVGFEKPEWLRPVNMEPKEASIHKLCGGDENKKTEKLTELVKLIGEKMQELSNRKSYASVVEKQKKLPGL